MTDVPDFVAPGLPEAPAPVVPQALSAGVLLQQARERAGVHLGMLSVALKVPVRQLMALEADDHALLSGPVFVRALTGSVCRHLRIDATPILAVLPQAPMHLQAPPPSLDSASSMAAHRWGRWSWPESRKFVLLIGLLLVSIGLVLGWPEWPATASMAGTSPASVSGTETLPAPAAPAASAGSPPMVVLLPSESATGAVPSGAVPTPKSQPASVGAAVLDLTFKGKGDDAWVEVKDGSGATVFNQLVRAGETHVVKGIPVLTVVVGLADAVDVQVRGQALDLSPFSRGAVARFEVK